jgi:hypothetical protein
MTVRDAKAIARHWCEHEANQIPGFVGAYLTGSTAWRDDTVNHSPASDIDTVAVIDADVLPEKLGKFEYRGGLLEIGFVSLADFSEIDTVLANYHLAGSFRKPTAVFDPSGRISEIQQASAIRFTEPEFVMRRLKHARQNALNFLQSYRSSDTLHDRVTCVIFAAGVTTHLVLTAALENPTVRRRYIASRDVLHRIGQPALHEHMLETLGSRELESATVQLHLENLATQFDIAGTVMVTPYQFAADMLPDARPVAIGGTQEMIDQGFHREALFWLIAVYCRSRAVISLDATEQTLAGFDDAYWQMLNAIGITSLSDLDDRAARVQQDIDRVFRFSKNLVEELKT